MNESGRRSSRATLGVSPFVLAEPDHPLATRLGVNAELTVLDELAGGDVPALSVARNAVDRLPDEVQVAAVAGVLLDQVDQDPPE